MADDIRMSDATSKSEQGLQRRAVRWRRIGARSSRGNSGRGDPRIDGGGGAGCGISRGAEHTSVTAVYTTLILTL